MTNERLLRQKNMAKTWAVNMGMIPHKDNSGKLVYGSEFIDNNGQIVSRKKTVKGKLNPNAFLHKPTYGVGVTKKVIKEKKRLFHKPKKIKQSDFREIPEHYRNLVNRYHKESL